MVAYIVNFTDPEVTPFNVNSFTTDGPVAPNTLQLSSSAVKASTSLVLYGKGHPEYGERIQENLVNLLENFSGSTEPTFPSSGQTWFSRITYVLIEGVGSPGNAGIYRWTDSNNSVGGTWTLLTNTGAVNPTVADEVKTIGAQPTTIVNGSFWLDTVGSPTIPELYLAVNSSTSNLTATFLKREMEDLTGLITSGELASGEYTPQKQLKVYDGIAWKNSGSVFTSKAPPQNPAIGDLWYHLDVLGSPPVGSPTYGGGSGPLSQLFIWARPGPGRAPQWLTTGYVDRQGDVMTGTLSFGLPTSSLFFWEGQGNDVSGPDIRMTGNGLLTSADNFYIHIDDDYSDLGAGNNVFEIATGSQNRGSPQRPLFQVQNDGVIRSALPLGSPEGSTYETLILSSDKNALVNRRYVDGFSADISGNTTNIATNTANLLLLRGGSPPTFSAKLNRAGPDQFNVENGALLFTNDTGSPQLGVPGIDMGDFLITNLQTPQAPEDAAHKQYVDDSVAALFGSPSPAGFNDGVVYNAIWDSTTNLLTLNRTEGLSDVTVVLTADVNSSEVTHTITEPFLRDTFQQVLFGSPIFGSPVSDYPLNTTQELINSVAVEDLNTRLVITEAPFAREIFTAGIGSPLAAGGSPALDLTTFVFTVDNYVSGTNRLHVYINGVKQYSNERAWQKISFLQNRPYNGLDNNANIDTDQPNISPSARTLLNDDNTSYTLDIAVDGAGAQTMTAAGSSLQLFDDIIDEINAQITGVTAVWNGKETAIVVYSNSCGTASQVTITDFGSPIGSSLLGALADISRGNVGSPQVGAGSPLAGLPTAYTQGDIAPSASGPISLISQNLSYREVTTGSPTIDATYGETTSTIVFNTQVNPGDVIELINVPVSP